MAGTRILGTFDDGRVEFAIDYDDNLDVLTFRCRNDSEQQAYGLLQRTNAEGAPDGVQYGMEAAAGELTTLAIPQGKDGIRLRPGSRAGSLGGYQSDLRFPF